MKKNVRLFLIGFFAMALLVTIAGFLISNSIKPQEIVEEEIIQKNIYLENGIQLSDFTETE